MWRIKWENIIIRKLKFWIKRIKLRIIKKNWYLRKSLLKNSNLIKRINITLLNRIRKNKKWLSKLDIRIENLKIINIKSTIIKNDKLWWRNKFINI